MSDLEFSGNSVTLPEPGKNPRAACNLFGCEGVVLRNHKFNRPALVGNCSPDQPVVMEANENLSAR